MFESSEVRKIVANYSKTIPRQQIMRKLYVVVRADLAPGAQLAQSVHAASAFAALYPAQHAAWQARDQVLVVLAIRDESALAELLRRAMGQGVLSAGFHEEDMNRELTACAFSGDVAKLVSSLPLALRAPRAA